LNTDDIIEFAYWFWPFSHQKITAEQKFDIAQRGICYCIIKLFVNPHREFVGFSNGVLAINIYVIVTTRNRT